MKRMFLLLLVLAFSVFSAAYAAGWQFARMLQMGARGPDVFALQKLLNENPETRVSETGAGSPERETNYFGTATARAVTAFQKQNAIVGEAGRVGSATLAVLNKRLVSTSAPFPRGSAEQSEAKGWDLIQKPPLPSDKSRSTPPYQGGEVEKSNPNARNLGQFLSIVKQVGEVQGYAPDKLETLTKEIGFYALGTTTDFFAQFAKEVSLKNQKISLESTLWKKAATVLQKIAGIFALHADAQAPSFGGMVVYVFPCTCSGNWLMGMVPLSVPPIVLMTHYSGSQTFQNFNAPFTLFLLGNYIPQGAPCLFYVGLACTTLPSQAQTSPVLGSS